MKLIPELRRNGHKIVRIKCGFCGVIFTKQASKALKSDVCKSCNGVSSAYTTSGADLSRSEFYSIYLEKLSSPDIVYKDDGFFFRCRFCLSEKKIRKDSIYSKKTTACDSCISHYKTWLHNNRLLSEREFYLKRISESSHKCIDIDSTVSKFGYDPSTTPMYSILPVIAQCDFCLCKFETSKKLLSKMNNFSSCNSCNRHRSARKRKCPDMDPRQYFLSLSKFSIPHEVIMATKEVHKYDPSLSLQTSKDPIEAKCSFCSVDVTVQLRSYIRSDGRVSCRECRHKKVVETLQNKYGVTSICAIPSVIEKMKDPYTNRLVESLLRDRYKVDFVREFEVKEYAFDFCIPSINLLIECQGDYFHDFKNNGYSGTPRDKGKSTYISKYTDYKLIHIWEHEIHLGRMVKILDHHIYKAIESNIRIDDMNLLEFSSVDLQSANKFLSKYHYLGGFTSASYAYGAFVGGELVCLCIFGGITRNQSVGKISEYAGCEMFSSNIRELKRFVIRPNVTCDNLASYSMSRFLKMLSSDVPSIRAVISFADPTVCDIGTIYKATNWKRLNDTPKSYHYLDTRTNKHVHKKTVWDWSCKNKMTESEFANLSGLIRVEESPKSVFLTLFSTKSKRTKKLHNII